MSKTLAETREKLIKKINQIENSDFLERISVFIDDSESLLNENQQNEVKERRIEYLKNSNEVISLDDFKNSIKAKYGF